MSDTATDYCRQNNRWNKRDRRDCVKQISVARTLAAFLTQEKSDSVKPEIERGGA